MTDYAVPIKGVTKDWGDPLINHLSNTLDPATGFIKEKAVMEADTAPDVAAGVANKLFVENQVTAAFPDDDAFGSWTNLDSLGGTLVKNEVYKMGSDGFIVITNNAVDGVKIVSDSANPPTVVRKQASASFGQGPTCPVKKGDYVEVTGTSQVPIIHWLPIGSGTLVKQ